MQRHFCHPEQSLRPVVNHPNRNRPCGIPDPAVLDDANIKLYDVAILNATRTSNPVNDLVVEGDTDITREYPMSDSISKECAANIVFLHEIGRSLILSLIHIS